VTTDSTERHDLDLSHITTVEAATFNGDVVIVVGSEPPRLEVVVNSAATYKVERLGSLLYVVGKKRGLTYAGSGATFHMWLPPGLSYKLATVNGTLRLRGNARGGVRALHASTVKGAIEIEAIGQAEVHLSTAPGSVHLRGANGRVKVSAINGATRLDEVSGLVDISCVNGAATITQAAGRIKVSSSNGDIQVTDATGQIQAATGKGAIRLERVTLEPGSVNWAKTGFGPVDVVGLRAPSGLNVHAKTHRQVIQAELPGYEIRASRGTLKAWLPGSRPAHLEVTTSSEISITA
jgi:hypothetical protein